MLQTIAQQQVTLGPSDTFVIVKADKVNRNLEVFTSPDIDTARSSIPAITLLLNVIITLLPKPAESRIVPGNGALQ